MSLRQDDPLQDSSLKSDIRKIFNLQYFEDIQPEIFHLTKTSSIYFKIKYY